jgi:hypothetical protein
MRNSFSSLRGCRRRQKTPYASSGMVFMPSCKKHKSPDACSLQQRGVPNFVVDSCKSGSSPLSGLSSRPLSSAHMHACASYFLEPMVRKNGMITDQEHALVCLNDHSFKRMTRKWVATRKNHLEVTSLRILDCVSKRERDLGDLFAPISVMEE